MMVVVGRVSSNKDKIPPPLFFFFFPLKGLKKIIHALHGIIGGEIFKNIDAVNKKIFFKMTEQMMQNLQEGSNAK